jgi:hypothetical protein
VSAARSCALFALVFELEPSDESDEELDELEDPPGTGDVVVVVDEVVVSAASLITGDPLESNDASCSEVDGSRRALALVLVPAAVVLVVDRAGRVTVVVERAGRVVVGWGGRVVVVRGGRTTVVGVCVWPVGALVVGVLLDDGAGIASSSEVVLAICALMALVEFCACWRMSAR